MHVLEQMVSTFDLNYALTVQTAHKIQIKLYTHSLHFWHRLNGWRKCSRVCSFAVRVSSVGDRKTVSKGTQIATAAPFECEYKVATSMFPKSVWYLTQTLMAVRVRSNDKISNLSTLSNMLIADSVISIIFSYEINGSNKCSSYVAAMW